MMNEMELGYTLEDIVNDAIADDSWGESAEEREMLANIMMFTIMST